MVMFKLGFLALLEIAAIALMSYGAWIWFEPAGLITAGILIYLEVNDVFKTSRTTGD